MKLLCALPLLLAAAPVAAHGSDHDDGSWSWCVAEATSPTGKVRYFSDPFEGDTSDGIRQVFVEYLTQAYAARDRTRGFTATCHTDARPAAAAASLNLARAAKPGVRDVATSWRFHFE